MNLYSIDKNQPEYKSFYNPLGDYSQMYKTIQDTMIKKINPEVYDYMIPLNDVCVRVNSYRDLT